jgi:hypothetical protein
MESPNTTIEVWAVHQDAAVAGAEFDPSTESAAAVNVDVTRNVATRTRSNRFSTND